MNENPIETAREETELHPDDHAYLANLMIGCAKPDHGAVKRVAAVREREGRRYVWRCDRCPESARDISMVIPEEGSALAATIRSAAPEAEARPETELHPDDGLTISSVGFFSEWPGPRMLRLDKELLGSQGRRTEYLFGWPDSPRIYVVVPHRQAVAAVTGAEAEAGA